MFNIYNNPQTIIQHQIKLNQIKSRKIEIHMNNMNQKRQEIFVLKKMNEWMNVCRIIILKKVLSIFKEKNHDIYFLKYLFE